MKKILALVGVVLFSASAFALNAVAPADEKCPGKATFEKYAAGQHNPYFITQHILINLADPMAVMSDEEAKPVAACYATYRVKEKSLVDFVRFHKSEFHPKEEGELATFANRVERLSRQADLEKVVAQNNDQLIMAYIVDNLVNPLAQMPKEQALAQAQEYKDYKVKGIPLSEFVRQHASAFDESVEIKLEIFADQVDSK